MAASHTISTMFSLERSGYDQQPFFFVDCSHGESNAMFYFLMNRSTYLIRLRLSVMLLGKNFIFPFRGTRDRCFSVNGERDSAFVEQTFIFPSPFLLRRFSPAEVHVDAVCTSRIYTDELRQRDIVACPRCLCFVVFTLARDYFQNRLKSGRCYSLSLL